MASRRIAVAAVLCVSVMVGCMCGTGRSSPTRSREGSPAYTQSARVTHTSERAGRPDPSRVSGGSGDCIFCNGDGEIGHADSYYIREGVYGAPGYVLPGETCAICGGDGNWDIDGYSDDSSEPDCAKCGGSGTEPCPNCGGRGAAPCAQCNGTGQASTRCSTCKGDGVLFHEQAITHRDNCQACRTRGYTDEICALCGGTGSWLGSTCFSCSGVGTIRTVCAACDGYGYTVRYVAGYARCWTCGGARAIPGTCASCSGSGRAACSRCGGQGEVPCSKCR